MFLTLVFCRPSRDIRASRGSLLEAASAPAARRARATGERARQRRSSWPRDRHRVSFSESAGRSSAASWPGRKLGVPLPSPDANRHAYTLPAGVVAARLVVCSVRGPRRVPLHRRLFADSDRYAERRGKSGRRRSTRATATACASSIPCPNGASSARCRAASRPTAICVVTARAVLRPARPRQPARVQAAALGDRLRDQAGRDPRRMPRHRLGQAAGSDRRRSARPSWPTAEAARPACGDRRGRRRGRSPPWAGRRRARPGFDRRRTRARRLRTPPTRHRPPPVCSSTRAAFAPRAASPTGRSRSRAAAAPRSSASREAADVAAAVGADRRAAAAPCRRARRRRHGARGRRAARPAARRPLRCPTCSSCPAAAPTSPPPTSCHAPTRSAPSRRALTTASRTGAGTPRGRGRVPLCIVQVRRRRASASSSAAPRSTASSASSTTIATAAAARCAPAT